MSTPTLADDAIVLTPAHPRLADNRQGAADQVEFETSRTADGRVCGLAFTSAESLVAFHGPDQPWVALPLNALRTMLGEAGVSLVVVDPHALTGREEGQVERG
ncbi:SAV_915 family protein [Streptomyces sp. URMC 126]|uniref:SAV_915 family protein n=1 Tax=Streptomyces sp. URMC 126 TaxID=3423401 RepID=UPI003F1CA679